MINSSTYLSMAVCALLLPPCVIAASPTREDTILFASTRDGSLQLYTLTPDHAVHKLTDGKGENSQASWSPDGKRIVMTSTRDGNPEIYIMDADGKNQRRLTHHDAADSDPVWSPDGKHIAFISYRDKTANIYVMDSHGKQLANVTAADPGVAKGQPAWAPDSKRLAYVNFTEGKGDIATVDIATGKYTYIAKTKASETNPVWSPDGQRLAYTSRNSSLLQIWVMNADGSEAQAVTPKEIQTGEARWTPDNQSLLVLTTIAETGRQDIAKVSLADGALANLTESEAEDNQPSLTPDGTAILFVSYRDGNAQLYRVTTAAGQSAQRLTYSMAMDAQPLARPRQLTRLAKQ
ncbi:DPP IV N-terminal domain-containing protein [Chitinivorax sp. B]|uniref:TolB family protein n=1 Tax=Chitinivorax sp. B TaxID=2502235 RepID=UPI0010F98ED0|nr:DPP IV N-terminal domain-containing protein [Chitinivorax sp. B]